MNAYGRLCTEFYDLDKPEPPPDAFAFYRGFAERAAGPILEPMCGSGRYLLPLLDQGFEIEGVEPSEAMRTACRKRAEARGQSPVLHAQPIEQLRLDRAFSLVLIPAGSFSLLIAEETVERSLARVFATLDSGGTFVVEVERTIERDPQIYGVWGGRWVDRADGAKLVLSWLPRDSGDANLSESLHRYELVESGRVTATEYEHFKVRSYRPDEFQELLERAGFTRIEQFKPYELAPLDESDEAVVFVGRKR